MKVRAGGSPGSAHQSNNLSLAHLLILVHQNALRMRVKGFPAIIVADNDGITVNRFVSTESNDPVSSRFDGSAGLLGYVYAVMEA